MTNFEQFIENVKAGKVEGAAYVFNGHYIAIDESGYSISAHKDFIAILAADHLCAHIRRWLRGMKFGFSLSSDSLEIDWYIGMGESDTKEFGEGTELDWHIDCANWVCEREGVEG